MANKEIRGLHLSPPVEGNDPDDDLLRGTADYIERQRGVPLTAAELSRIDGLIADLGVLAQRGLKPVPLDSFAFNEEGLPPDAA